MTIFYENKTIDISHQLSGLAKKTSSISSELSISCSIIGMFSNSIESILEIQPSLESKLSKRYGIASEMSNGIDMMGSTELTRVISGEYSTDLISYRVTQEWAAPYDIAELRYRKFPDYEIGDYILIQQRDYFTDNLKTIFRGITIGMDKTYKKNFEETIVKAVSNEWYLTKQYTFWDEYLEHLSLFSTINAKRYVKYWLGRGSFEHGSEGVEWERITGVRPFVFVDVPDWITTYCQTGECNFNFLLGKTTKRDAINQLCDGCDFTFWCGYSGPFAKRHAFFYPRSMIEEGYYPFGEQITIDATDEAWGFNKRLLEITSREEQTTFDTKINRVAMTCKEFPIVYKEKAFTGEVGGPKPVEIHRAINWAKVQTIEQLQDVCNSLYEYLRKSNIVYEAKLLSLTEKADHTTLHTGMKIKFQNVNGHPEDVFRIMKITHDKFGDKPIAETTIEYRDTDLIHLGSPKLNEIGTILNHVENEIEQGERIPGYSSATNPRAVSLGDTDRISIGKVVSYNETENTVDIQLDKTNQVVKGIKVI